MSLKNTNERNRNMDNQENDEIKEAVNIIETTAEGMVIANDKDFQISWKLKAIKGCNIFYTIIISK